MHTENLDPSSNWPYGLPLFSSWLLYLLDTPAVGTSATETHSSQSSSWYTDLHSHRYKNTVSPTVTCLSHLVYLVVGSWIQWSPSCLVPKTCTHTNISVWLLNLPGANPQYVLVSWVTCMDFLVPSVVKSQTLCSLQYLVQTRGCSSIWLSSLLVYLPASPRWCLLAISHSMSRQCTWSLASLLADIAGTWAL